MSDATQDTGTSTRGKPHPKEDFHADKSADGNTLEIQREDNRHEYAITTATQGADAAKDERDKQHELALANIGIFTRLIGVGEHAKINVAGFCIFAGSIGTTLLFVYDKPIHALAVLDLAAISLGFVFGRR